MRFIVLTIAIAVFASLCVQVNSVTSQEPPMPPESTLPEAESAAPLPPESVLPSDSAPSNDDAKEQPLPPENLLPGPVPAERSEVAPFDEAKFDATSDPDRRPHLRLDYSGHTGMIRDVIYLANPDRLVSVGDDKVVHVWRRDPRTKQSWIHDRAIRWQVTRGDAGRIYCVAGNDRQIAIAGNGAMGGHGEIIVLDVLTGEFVRPLVQTVTGHLEVVGGLAWNGDSIASADLRGQIMRWKPDAQTGIWNGDVVQKDDSQSLGKAIAEQLVPYRQFVPIAFRGNGELVFAKFDRFDEKQNNVATWRLARRDTFSGKEQVVESVRFLGDVRIIKASDDGRLVATAGTGTTIDVLKLDEKRNIEASTTVNIGAQPSFVDIFELAGSDAKQGARSMMIVGTEIAGVLDGKRVARLQVWDISEAAGKMIAESFVEGVLAAGQFDPKGPSVIVAAGSDLLVFAMDAAGKLDKQPTQRMFASASPVVQVAFAKDKPYRIAFKRSGESNPAKQADSFDDVFDLSQMTLQRNSKIDSAAFLLNQRLTDAFTIRGNAVGGSTQFELSKLRGNEAPESWGTLPLVPAIHGVPSAIATTNPDKDNEAIVVGTTGRNNLYVYSAKKSDPPRLIRQFRGHTSPVQSISVSHDGQYMVSGAADSTIMVWNLQDMFTCSESVNRWGIEFEIDDGKVIASDVRDDGPLYFRGIRSGDRLLGISWATQAGDVTETSDANSIVQQLSSVPMDTLVAFRFSRLGRPIPTLQSFPAWQPLATLVVDNDREWMCWTPAGYYDASFNGHQRFGWQINRGIERLPDYFRAAQFREALERPRVMKRLLEFGSLPSAMRRSLSQLEPPPGESAIVNQYRTQPRITIESPIAGETIQGDRLDVLVKIDVPLGAELSTPKAFISGIPTTSVTRIENQDEVSVDSGATTHRYRMTFALPDDPELILEVIAATDSAASDRSAISLTHEIGAQNRVRPRLHLIAIGVSNYRDPQIQSLDFPADSTTAVVDAFRKNCESLYQVSSEQLVNDDAVRPLWKVYAQDAYERLRETVSPNDLVVMYLCGHGFRDRQSDQWYFVTADANYRDLMNDQYADCISFDDLSLLSALPCRKLAILDSCHSGAVQPVMQNDDLKTAMRQLQSDVVITVTASEGDEEAAEERETGLGRFTRSFVEALGGKGDIDGDKETTLREIIDHVVRDVDGDSNNEGRSQHPTASPSYLTDRIEIPMSRR